MADLPSNFCVAAFLQLTTHPSGSFSPCPYLGGTTWRSESGSIQRIWRGEDLERLRQQFIRDEKPSVCHRCWHEETNGKRSLRQRLYDPITGSSDYSVINHENLVADLVHGLADKQYLAGPRILTIKNGNVCNAKCRSCHPGDSSRWIEDAVKLQSNLGHTHYPINQIEKNWSDEQLDEIFELCQNLDRLELFGGEPLYNKKVLALLDRIVQSGHSSHIDLYINTNGSVDVVTRVPDISRFRQVEIGVSIDAVEDRFEYLRHGLQYHRVIDNIGRWQNYFHEHSVRYSIDSISTVSVFNILHLPDLKRAVMAVLPQAPFWNLLIDPDYLFIKNMPDDLKRAASHALADDPDFSDLITVMQQPADPQAWPRFLEITSALDHIRGEDFSRTFPELAQHIT